MAYVSKHSGKSFDNVINDVPIVSDLLNNINSNHITIKNQLNEIQEFINNLSNTVLELAYPIGSLYTSFNNISPATFLGGSWEQIKDTFLLAAGDLYPIGTSGGSSSVTLSID